jgi:hypothetical protein
VKDLAAAVFGDGAPVAPPPGGEAARGEPSTKTVNTAAKPDKSPGPDKRVGAGKAAKSGK